MPSDLAISVAGIGKTYRVHKSEGAKLASQLWPQWVGGTDYPALVGVDLEIRRGEAVGIVGRNGSGKSTLLQIICGLVVPTTGTVRCRGRVAAILELGAGFDPDFTGRENVKLSAAVLGLTDDQIAARFDAIVAYSGIGDFIDRPVREYSSGMYARLAFALSIHVDADVLVIDEILSVGDAAFQRRCLRSLKAFQAAGGTLLFVSHDPASVQAQCERAVWLDRGQVRADGPSDAVCAFYLEEIQGSEAEFGGAAPDMPREPVARRHGEPWQLLLAGEPVVDPRWSGANPIVIRGPGSGRLDHGEGGATIEAVSIHDTDGAPLTAVQGGAEAELRIACTANRDLRSPIVGYILRNERGENICGDNTYLRYREQPLRVAAGDRFVARFLLQLPYLATGAHTIAPSVIEGTQHDHIHLHWIENALVLDVLASPVGLGAVGVPMLDVSCD